MFSTRVRLIDPSDQNALQDWIVIIEMLLAGVGMLFAFPYTEFKKGGSLTGWNMGAFTHAISIQDVISDTLHQVRPVSPLHTAHMHTAHTRECVWEGS